MNIQKILISVLVILVAIATGFMLDMAWFYLIMIVAIYLELSFGKENSDADKVKEEPRAYKKKCKECKKSYTSMNKHSRFCLECIGGESK